MLKKGWVKRTLLTCGLVMGAVFGPLAMAPANAAPMVVVTQDGWGLRSTICNWFPYWC